MLAGITSYTGNQKIGALTLSGKRKDKVVDIENEQEEEDENIADSQDKMEMEENGNTTMIIATTHKGIGYQTNSQQELTSAEMRLK
jgi:uncharacterized membrane protein